MSSPPRAEGQSVIVCKGCGGRSVRQGGQSPDGWYSLTVSVPFWVNQTGYTWVGQFCSAACIAASAGSWTGWSGWPTRRTGRCRRTRRGEEHYRLLCQVFTIKGRTHDSHRLDPGTRTRWCSVSSASPTRSGWPKRCSRTASASPRSSRPPCSVSLTALIAGRRMNGRPDGQLRDDNDPARAPTLARIVSLNGSTRLTHRSIWPPRGRSPAPHRKGSTDDTTTEHS